MSENGKVKITDLAALVKSKRGKQGLRAVAKEAGISPSTLSRVEQGKIPDLQTLSRLCDWLHTPLSEFIQEGNITNSSPINPNGMDTPSVIEAHLRADRELNPETAQAIASMVRAAYNMFSKKGTGEE